MDSTKSFTRITTCAAGFRVQCTTLRWSVIGGRLSRPPSEVAPIGAAKSVLARVEGLALVGHLALAQAEQLADENVVGRGLIPLVLLRTYTLIGKSVLILAWSWVAAHTAPAIGCNRLSGVRRAQSSFEIMISLLATQNACAFWRSAAPGRHGMTSPGWCTKSSTKTSPTRTRMRRSVGCPTDAVILRTCRNLPSTSVSAIQLVGVLSTLPSCFFLVRPGWAERRGGSEGGS
mmetsp:Transcript_33353/g.87816  ORF Transcript_33353/g.87816 Transcript_33353/m.87816 type:complete len:232 (+) Transcript_33353:125-820(+)